MSLPPLANLLALHDPDPLALERVAADLASGGEFDEVWRPAPTWIAAIAPLPGGDVDGETTRQRGLAFAEGRFAVGRAERAASMVDSRPEGLAALSGDFGFIRFHPDGAATVVRSCGGLVPFYLWQAGRCACVVTRLTDLVHHLPDEPRLDPLINAVWTTGHGVFPDHRTFIAGVSILGRGCFARLDPPDAPRVRQYWDPRPSRLERPTPQRTTEHAERLRALLIENLARDLDPQDGNLLTLSGGVDSSSLAALATRVVGRPIWTWSLAPEPEELFRHEMGYIRPLREHCGVARSWVVRFGAATRLELLRSAPRLAFHIVHPALCALPGILREAPVRVLFGGEFADEVCGSAFTLPDWAAATSLAALIRGLGRLPFGRRDVLRWVKHYLQRLTQRPGLPFPADLPAFVLPELRIEYRDWLERRRRDAARDDRPHGYLALRAEADGFVAMNWEAASTLGVRRSFPFFNREVLELAFQCHPAELVGPGPKKLLRTALRHDVPAVNLGRADRGRLGSDFMGAQHACAHALPEGLRPIVRAEWFRPFRSLEHGEAHGLEQLELFVSSLALHRHRGAASLLSNARSHV